MKLAIIRMSALGDIVHSMVILQFIKKHYPESSITWITEDRFFDVLNFNPHIDKLIVLNLKRIKKEKSFKLLKSEINLLRSLDKFDMILDAQGLIKSAVVSFFLKGDVCGLDKKSAREPLSSLFYHKKIFIPCFDNVVYRNLNLASNCLNFSYTKDEIIDKEAYLFYDKNKDYSYIDKFLSKKEKNILFVTNSSSDNKNYPKDKYIEISKRVDANFLTIWANEKEKMDAEYLSFHSNIKVLPKLAINDLKYLISKVDLVVGGDTGPTHMAWAVNKPSVVLFGYTPTSMMFETDINIAVKSGYVVNGCRFDKNNSSIKNIDVNVVITTINKLLNK